MDLDMVHVYGKWNKKNTTVRHPLQHGLQGIQSKRGMTGSNHNPFVALCRHTATEEQGEAWGMNLVYSGNFAIDIEVDTQGCPRVLLGHQPHGLPLAPGARRELPDTRGCAGLLQHRPGRHEPHLPPLLPGPPVPQPVDQRKRPLLINSWEAAYFDFDDDKLVEFAKGAKELGIDMLVMDDGWFGNRNDDQRALGDWWVNEKKLKGGLSYLIQRVNDLGIEFGIWYEPEMISPDSDLYRAHPDWAICAQGRVPSIARKQYVLDMTRQDVRDIFQQMYDVLSQNNIAYIKWDCNRHITEVASAQSPRAGSSTAMCWASTS